MSISTMTNYALARRVYAPRVAATPGTGTSGSGAASATGPAPEASSALASLTAYIPTETVTLYLGARAAMAQTAVVQGATVAASAHHRSEYLAFALSAAATPLLVWLVYAAKLKNANRPLPLPLRTWPQWEMCAATIAFCSWAIGLPNSFLLGWDKFSPALAGLSVMVVSVALGVLSPLFARRG